MLPLIISAISAILAIISNIALFITPYYAILTIMSFLSVPIFSSAGLFSLISAQITGIVTWFFSSIIGFFGLIQSLIFMPITIFKYIFGYVIGLFTCTTQAAAIGTGGILSALNTLILTLYSITIGNLISIFQYVFAIPISLSQIPMMIYMCFRTMFINMLIWLIG